MPLAYQMRLSIEKYYGILLAFDTYIHTFKSQK